MSRKLLLVLLTLLFTLHISGSNLSKLQKRYNTDNPLTYIDSWDYPPFCFVDINHQCSGYSVDVVREIARRLQIPLKVRLQNGKPWEAYKKGRTQFVLISYHDKLITPNGRFGLSTIDESRYGYIESKQAPSHINSVGDLRNHKFFISENSTLYNILKSYHLQCNAMLVDDPKDAILDAAVANKGIVLWHEKCLRYVKDSYHLDNMDIHPLNTHATEYRFFSRDKLLLDEMDSVFEAMRNDGTLEEIQNKWYYPERAEAKIIHERMMGLALVSLLIVILIVIALLWYRNIYKKLIIKKKTTFAHLKVLFDSGKIFIYVYDLQKDKFLEYDASGNLIYADKAHIFGLFCLEATSKIRSLANYIVADRMPPQNFTLVRNEEKNDRVFQFHLEKLDTSSVHREQVVCLMRDVTEENVVKRKEHRNMLRYKAAFNYLSLDTMYFDAVGVLKELNDKACRTFGVINKTDSLESGIHLEEIVGLDQVNISKIEAVSMVTRTDAMSISERQPYAQVPKTGYFYYESTFTPMYDSAHQLIGIFLVGRDVTEQVMMTHQREEKIKLLGDTAHKANLYLKQANVSLNRIGMRIVTYYPDTHSLELRSEFNKVMVTLSPIECMRYVGEEEKAKVSNLFMKCDNLMNESFTVQVKTYLKNDNGDELRLEFSCMPVLNQQGTVSYYYGLCIDVTESVLTEEMIRTETKKALEADRIKNAFLNSVSHDVRTPLNAVVGFAQMLAGEHSKEDEHVFVDQIQKNSQSLLDLVNNVLLLSRIEANMVEIHEAEYDFAELFEGICDECIEQYQMKNIEFVKYNPYDHLVGQFDMANIKNVIEKLLCHSIQYSQSEYTRISYNYYDNEVTIVVEDTGIGADQKYLNDTLKGNNEESTGGDMQGDLALSIVGKLVRLMHGHAEVQCDYGRGTTFWVFIPCEVKIVGKKGNAISNE
jgi:ABC-type amino acid transport substrate-binding protein